MNPVFIGIDPGKTTGIFVYSDGFTTSLQVTDRPNDLVDRIEAIIVRALNRQRKVILAVERFDSGTVAGHHHTRQDDPVQIITLVKKMAADNDVPFIEIQAATTKSIITDRKLRDLGWYIVGQRHANDAARNVLLAMLQLLPVLYEAHANIWRKKEEERTKKNALGVYRRQASRSYHRRDDLH